MRIHQLAQILADTDRIGLTPELAEKLKVRSEDATRGQLLAEQEDGRGHLGVYLLSVYVVDDTDFWGDGEIYWWAIPSLVDKTGQATWGARISLPSGAPPHKVGSLEWMTNFSLQDPPLVALIPPSDDVAAAVVRLGFYDDDGEAANVPKAMTAGLEVLAGYTAPTFPGPDQIILPVRDAIFRSLKAEDDDILIDQDLTLRRGSAMRFGAGHVGSVVNSMIRIYYFVRDEEKTEQAGPFNLHKGQIETIRFRGPLESGGKITVFSRGAEVNITTFGTLNTDSPFANRVLDAALAKTLSEGFNVNASGAAKVIAYYTPP